MQKVLATSTAARPTGSPPQRRLLKVPFGPFAGRLAAVYADSANGIALKYADYPYQSWSAAQAVASDAHDSPFSACIDSAGRIYVAYTDTSLTLKVRKLTFAGGQWAVGAAATIINVDESYRPVILKDPDGKLWCLFDHFYLSSDARHYVRAKSSIDDGQTWGSGPSDLGTALSAAWLDPAYPSVSAGGQRLYAVYCVNHECLKLRICNLADCTWQPESSIFDIADVDDRFDAAISGDGRLGVIAAPTSGDVYFKEYDGIAWGALIEIESGQARGPQLSYLGSTPEVVYSKYAGNGYYIPRYARKSGDSFAPGDISPAFGFFDTVLLYCPGGSPEFQDKTVAASSTAEGDIYHSHSNGMLDNIGDCIYLGKLSKFHRAAVVLSTAGLGGEVAWEYWNGVAWTVFTPFSGNVDFDSSDSLLLFWSDLSCAPADWQISAVLGIDAFWVRARVTTGYSTNPVGTQILAGSKLDDLALGR